MLIKDLETINHLLKVMDDLLVLRCKDNPLLLIRILVYLGYKESLQEHVYVSDLKYTGFAILKLTTFFVNDNRKLTS